MAPLINRFLRARWEKIVETGMERNVGRVLVFKDLSQAEGYYRYEGDGTFHETDPRLESWYQRPINAPRFI